MSGELDVKVNKRSGSGRSGRSRSSSFRTSSKGAKTSGTAADNSEEESLTLSSRSAKAKVESSSPSKGNINAPTNTSNLSLHQNNQNPSQSQDKSCSSSSLAAAVPTEVAGSSSSLSSRLSLKNLGRKKSPVRSTHFNLPATEAPTSSSSATAADQIPKDSISGTPNTSSVPAGGAATNSNLSNNNTGSNNKTGGGESVAVSRHGSSRGLLIKNKKDRGGSSSASPPLHRASQQQQPVSSASSVPKLTALAASSTNPVPSLSTAVKTEPADPSIPWIPGTSAPISVDRAHSVKITRKILQNWRTACGRTKDNFIRRWKTLPENHPDFEQCPSSPGTSKKKGCSTSNLNTHNTSSSPATPKKKVDKSAKSGVGESGTASGPSITVNSTTTRSTTTSTVATSIIKNEPRKEFSATNTTESATTTSTATKVPQAPKPVTGPELQSSNSSNIVASNKLSFGQQQRNATADNEMPVVGIIGKGSLSASGGGTEGASANSSGLNSNTTGGGGMLGSRLGSSMMGRPSISVNSSSGALNGRTGAGDGGTGPSPGGSSGPPGGQQKSTGWTVHVWTTYVQRHDLEQGLEMEEPKKPDRDYLSDFQKVKLTHFFRHVLDMNHDDVISAEDFVALNQRIRHYIEWSSECIEFHILKEVHSGFLECFLNQPLDECSVMYYCNSDRETRQNVNIDEWLDVWGGLLRSARTMESLPLWLQYFPKILFQVINKSGSGTISREELRAFYTMFLGIDFRVVNETLESIHKAMTDGGRHKITYDLFKLCFANFLIGKYPNGPGQYLFGICSPQTLECSFPIDYSALNTDPSDLEPYNPETDKNQSNRRSVIV